MANELAAESSKEALANFKNIDSDHSGSLSLLDIMNYDKKGANQHELAQFLEDNFDKIHGLSVTNFDPMSKQCGNITPADLRALNILAGADKGALADLHLKEIVGGAAWGAKSAGEFALLPAVAVGAAATMAFGGRIGALSGLAIEGLDAIGGAIAGAIKGNSTFNKELEDVKDMRK